MIIQENSPDKGSTTYVRDVRGLVTQRTDPNSVVTTYSYDNAGRIVSAYYSGSTGYYSNFTWDSTANGNYGIGKLVSITDQSGSDTRYFDSKGRITTVVRGAYPMQAYLSTSYTYDLAGNITGMTYPSGHAVTYQRDAMGRVTTMIGVPEPNVAGSPTFDFASGITWNPYGPIASLTLGNGEVESFTLDTDYRITGVKVQMPGSTTAVVNRAMTWVGEDLTAITDSVNSANSQTFTYTPANRLASAVGPYGSYAWTYDGTGNRTSETLASVVSAYAYPTTSNRLTSITPGTGTPRSFSYDAAGNTLSDSRTGALGLGYAYDVENRLAVAQQTSATANTSYYISDAQSRLSTRTVNQSAAPTSTTTNYFYDLKGHLIAEMNPTGTATLREYFWLDDIPVAVVDWVSNASPTVYYVHVDHLSRPIRMTDGSGNIAWDVTYSPFGATTSITQNPEVMNGRFPGQWFQLETGLAYNWHRHYDATTGRYLQADPLTVDDGNTSIAGLPDGTISGAANQKTVVKSMGWKEAHDIVMSWSLHRPVMLDGPSVYGYSKQSPATVADPLGLVSSSYSPIPPSASSSCQIDPFCKLHKERCIATCSGTSLPTYNFGYKFFNCVNKCMDEVGCLGKA